MQYHEAVTHLVKDIQVLEQGIASSGRGSVVRVVDGVVEVARLDTSSLVGHGDGPFDDEGE